MISLPASQPAEAHARPSKARGDELDVLVLSSSLFTDRMMLHTHFLSTLGRAASVEVWATSMRNGLHRGTWGAVPAQVEEFPPVLPYKAFPYNYLRRLNDWAWDYCQHPASRMSHTRHVRDKTEKLSLRALKAPGYLLALSRSEAWFENRLERLLLDCPRSPEAQSRLRAARPDVIVTTNPFWFHEPAVVAQAKKLGLTTLAMIPSWDNVTTKNRLVFKYDGYLVWSQRTKQELYEHYPAARRVPVYVVGAPQFDVFFRARFAQSREEFCRSQGLRPERPVVVYALGSPNIVREHHAALELAERVSRGELGDVQMIVRPHPIHDYAELSRSFARFAPRVHLQQTGEAGSSLYARSQDDGQVTEWVNTFRHADVVVNLASTVTIDAAICDRPVVNLDYDPEPGRPNQALVRDINHLWPHFKPVAESGGVWLAGSGDEMVEAVRTYLRRPELHRAERRKVAEFVCGYLDGRCGERMARSVLEFARVRGSKRKRYGN
jgi:hypothetical protein